MAGVTADGSPVELYQLLPPGRDPETVDAALAPGADILDLGCGTGRIALPLAESGHRVLAVDDSPEMLACVARHDSIATRRARIETLLARVEDVRLDRRFGGVLLASHLLNLPAAETRHGLLATAAHHLTEAGRLVAQWHPPEWFDTAAETKGRMGQVDVHLDDVTRDGDLLSATVRYRAGDRQWAHPFTVRRLSEADLSAALGEVGLELAGWLTADRTWFAADRRRTR